MLLLAVAAAAATAQDRLLPELMPQALTPGVDTLRTYQHIVLQVNEPTVQLPASFRGTEPNILEDSLEVLAPFWEKLRRSLLRTRADSVRIVHIGDSHVRGHLFPRAAGELLQRRFRRLSYTDRGINGATCVSFTNEARIQQIAALKPDLLILSLGTNESHNRRYNSQTHYHQLDELVRLLRAALPDVPLLLTTPPGSYDRSGTRRRRTYKVNPRTEPAARTIRRFALHHGLAVWNLYEIAGGSRQAARNWWEAGLMRPDHVHYLAPAYVLQGELLAQALIYGYNDYVGY
jgi:lysophospholipase L1-like esterase